MKMFAVTATLTFGVLLTFFVMSNRHLTSKVESNRLTIGALLCLTGDCAEWGNNSLMGMQLAADEINAGGGVLGHQIEIVAQDSKEASGGSNSVTAYRQLMLNTSINFVVGPTWTAGGLPLAPIAAKNMDSIIISPSLGVSQFNETAPNIFNIWPHDSKATTGLARFAHARGYKRVAILSGNDAWVTVQGDTFEKEFKRLGGEITIKVQVNPGTRDVRTEALKISRTTPDAVFYADTYNMASVARELKILQYAGAQLSILMDDTRLREAQGALERTFFAMYPEVSADFQRRFQMRYAMAPGIAADTGYDAVKLYAAAISKAKSFDARVVGPVLLDMKLEGASGEIKFDDFGGVERTPKFYQVNNGAYLKLE